MMPIAAGRPAHQVDPFSKLSDSFSRYHQALGREGRGSARRDAPFRAGRPIARVHVPLLPVRPRPLQAQLAALLIELAPGKGLKHHCRASGSSFTTPAKGSSMAVITSSPEKISVALSHPELAKSGAVDRIAAATRWAGTLEGR
jgi:hypothetical protein